MAHRVLAISVTTLLVVALTPLVHAASFYAANNGVDAGGCGSKTSPCRSIGQTIANAAPGDKVIVGPGTYGDLNGNGTLGEAGEENPAAFSPGCGCVLALNKAVSLESSNGAAETIIYGRSVAASWTVLIITDGGAFGKPGKGFFVTQSDGGNHQGIVIDADHVSVRGNQLIPINPTSIGTGIETVDSPGSILIDGNQILGWATGIVARGANKTVRKNVVTFSGHGINAREDAVITGNVVIKNSIGVLVGGTETVVGNAAISNSYGFSNAGIGPPGNGLSFSGVIEKNDIFGNSCGVRNDSMVGLKADQNFWGVAAGPGPDPADDVCNSSGGTTTVTPVAGTLFKVRPPLKP